MQKIEFFKHNLSEQDLQFATEVMRSIFITTGPMVQKFEQQFAQYLQISEAVGLTSLYRSLALGPFASRYWPGR